MCVRAVCVCVRLPLGSSEWVWLLLGSLTLGTVPESGAGHAPFPSETQPGIPASEKPAALQASLVFPGTAGRAVCQMPLGLSSPGLLTEVRACVRECVRACPRPIWGRSSLPLPLFLTSRSLSPASVGRGPEAGLPAETPVTLACWGRPGRSRGGGRGAGLLQGRLRFVSCAFLGVLGLRAPGSLQKRPASGVWSLGPEGVEQTGLLQQPHAPSVLCLCPCIFTGRFFPCFLSSFPPFSPLQTSRLLFLLFPLLRGPLLRPAWPPPSRTMSLRSVSGWSSLAGGGRGARAEPCRAGARETEARAESISGTPRLWAGKGFRPGPGGSSQPPAAPGPLAALGAEEPGKPG